MTPLFVDIETIGAQSPRLIDEIAAAVKHPAQMKKADTIAKWEAEDKPTAVADALRATSLDGAYGEIILIGMAIGTGPIEVLRRVPELGNDEAGLLERAFQWLEDNVGPGQQRQIQIVGHRVVDFDLRFMWQRAVIHGIRPPDWMPWLVKPWDERVFDTMVQWAGVGKGPSLDKLCSVLGVARKGTEIGEDIDGSRVWEFWQAGRIDELAAYCAADVSRARELYARMRFMPTAFSA